MLAQHCINIVNDGIYKVLLVIMTCSVLIARVGTTVDPAGSKGHCLVLGADTPGTPRDRPGRPPGHLQRIHQLHPRDPLLPKVLPTETQ